MQAEYELVVVGDGPGAAQPAIRVEPGRPLYVGRGPQNDVIVPHAAVSSRHLCLRLRGDVLVVEDLASSNGTQVDGLAVVRSVDVTGAAVVVLGGAARLEVRRGAGRAVLGQRRWLVRRSDGTAFAVDSDRFVISTGAEADLRVPGGGALLVLDGEGGLFEAVDDDLSELQHGDRPGGLPEGWTVEQASAHTAATIDVQRVLYAYDVTVHSGAPARVSITSRTASCEITALNRVAMLTVLVQHFVPSTNTADDGWCADTEIALGIWGKTGRARSIKVVLCRTRAELRQAGLDGWCIEKRGSYTRLRVASVNRPSRTGSR